MKPVLARWLERVRRRFHPLHRRRAEAGGPLSLVPRTFGYLGRLSPKKGIEDLLEAYEMYRASTSDPWDLRVAGAGSLGPELDRYHAVTRSGFVQPAGSRAWMRGIGCLVVPSRSESCGVALAEGAWAGLAIVATDTCGDGRYRDRDLDRVGRSDSRRLAGHRLRHAVATAGRRWAELPGSGDHASAWPQLPWRWEATDLNRRALCGQMCPE